MSKSIGWPEKTERIIVQWSDEQAGFVYALQKITLPLLPRSDLRLYWQTVSTGKREKALRWGDHYKIDVPSEPSELETLQKRLTSGS